MTKHHRILFGLLILLVATFFRLWMFDDVPPGLQHDEIFKAEEGIRLVETGDFRLFYPTNQGHEGAFVWLLGLSYIVVGVNPLMIKLPAFICGILTVALIFRLGWRAYSPVVGIVASGLTAVSFWGVFTSRVGLRAVMLPMVVLLVLLGIQTLLKSRKNATLWLLAGLIGITLGFSIYTYTSAFVLHLVIVIFFPALWLLQRNLFNQRWRELLIVVVVAGCLALPMVVIRLTDPEGTNRATSIATPLVEAQAGKPQVLINNALKLAGMPAFVGDPTWRYNVSGRPLFLLPLGLLVYVGMVIALRRIRQNPLNILLLGLAILGLIPSLLTVLAPSYLRSIITLPSMMLFIGIAVWQIELRFPQQKWLAWGLVAVIIGLTGVADYQAYFFDWAQSQNPILTYHDEMEQGATVFEIYRDDLQQLAKNLQNVAEPVVFVSTPDSELDPLIYKFSGAPPPDKVHVVFFNAFANIVLSEQPSLLFVSPLSPISEKHQQWLTDQYGTTHIKQILRQDGELAFDVYRVSNTKNVLAQTLEDNTNRKVFVTLDGQQESIDFPINFGDLVLFRGIQIPRETVYGENDGVNNQLYFEPLVKASGATVNVFLHLVDEENTVVAQRDLLGVSPAYWHPDTIFIQDNFVPFWEPVPAGNYRLLMGVYDWQTEIRVPILDEFGQPIADHLILGTIEVLDPIEE